MSAALQIAAPALLWPRTATLRAGTRQSPLALAQTRLALRALASRSGDQPVLEEVPLGTTGDREHRRLAEIGGKGLFAKEIHEALLDGRVDFAVHSLKDLETELPAGIAIAAVLPREDVRDAVILSGTCPPEERRVPLPALPIGARIGTASARRAAQLRHMRPDLRFGLLRGNVQTRLRLLDGGDFAATLLALAGLNRLGLQHRASLVLDPEQMLPAAGQGIIAITARADDDATLERLAALDDPAARLAMTAERALLAALDGSCRTPIGAYAHRLPGGRVRLTGLVAREDGSFLLRRQMEGAEADAARIGQELAAELRAGSPADLFA